jgi:hypothetical protein
MSSYCSGMLLGQKTHGTALGCLARVSFEMGSELKLFFSDTSDFLHKTHQQAGQTPRHVLRCNQPSRRERCLLMFVVVGLGAGAGPKGLGPAQLGRTGTRLHNSIERRDAKIDESRGIETIDKALTESGKAQASR